MEREKYRHRLANGDVLDMRDPESIRVYVAQQLALNATPTAAELKRLEMLEARAAALDAASQATASARDAAGPRPLAGVTDISEAEEMLRRKRAAQRYASRNNLDEDE